MPAMSGEQFRGVVQKHPAWSKIPIIVCTADRAPDVAAVGAFGVLYKPFDLEKLLELVRSACAALLNVSTDAQLVVRFHTWLPLAA